MPRVRAARQRHVLLPDHHTVGPVGGTHRDVAGVAAKPASEIRIADDHEALASGTWSTLVHSLGLHVAVVPFSQSSPLEVRVESVLSGLWL